MTTGLTPVYAIPYPEGNELVIGGDDAMQAIAERLEALLTPAYFNAEEYNGTLQNAAPAGVTVDYNAPQVSHTSEFSVAAGVVTYTGPTRPVVIAANVSFHGRPDTQQIVDLHVGGVRRRRSESLDSSAPGAFAGWQAHALSWTGLIPSGTTISVSAADGVSSALWYPSLSIISTGPRQ